MAFGPASMGPALTAFSPPEVDTHGTYLANTPLVGYRGDVTWSSGTRPSMEWCWRDDDVIADVWGGASDPDNSTQQGGRYFTADYTTGIITASGLEWFPLQSINFTADQGYNLPTGISAKPIIYYPVNINGTKFQISTTPNGSPISFSDNGTGGGSHLWVNKNEPVYTGDETYYMQGYSITESSRLPYRQNATTAIGTKHWLPGKAFWGNDYLAQSGVWIKTPSKEGILFLGTFTTGRAWYWGSTVNADSYKHSWLIYSRNQFASVAGGTSQDQIQPAKYVVQFPGLTYPLPKGSGLPRYACTGMAYDAVNQNLYVAIMFASNAPAFNSSSCTVIYVYHVDDTILPPIAAAPKSLINKHNED
jgi:hypothetical protein